MTRRFFLDGRKLGDGGIGTFIETIVDGLISANEAGLGPFVVDMVVNGSYVKQSGIPVHWEDKNYINIFLDDTPKYSFSEYFIFPLRWRKVIKKSSLYISPHYTLPFFIPIKTLVVIHDLIQLTYSDSTLKKFIQKNLIKTALKRADEVATVSKNSREKISDFFNLDQSSVSIIPNAVRLPFLTESVSESSDVKYFLFVSSDRLHKRLDVFLEFIKLARSTGIVAKGIVISKLSNFSRELIDRYDLESSVEVYENVNITEMSKIYHGSSALVCTSLEEGFCLPILEAMASETSIICPDLGYAKELAKDAATYFASESAADILLSWNILESDHEGRRQKQLKGKQLAASYDPLTQFKALLECA